MRKTLLLSLIALSVVVAGCDRGQLMQSNKVPSKLKVRIERLQFMNSNENLTVYAMDFRKEGRTLTFVCPCHIPGSGDLWLNVRVEDDLFKLTLLPDAEYRVKVQYWAPNADGNKEVKFTISP